MMASAGCCSLEEQFENATRHLETLVSSLEDEQKLYFYARYKQAKEGPCTIPKPSFFNFAAKRKWMSWNELANMGNEQAMREYVEAILKIDPEWDPASKASDEKALRLGLSVSTLKRNPEDFISDENKSVFDWAKEGAVDKVKELLESNSCDINEKDEEGMSLLHWACDRGHLPVVELLLSKNAEANARDGEGQTPLHYASFCGHASTVDVLLKHGADATLVDNEGSSPANVASDSATAQLFINR